MIDLAHIDLVIFDCDGVLVDSEPHSNAVLTGHAARLGWEMDMAASQSHFLGMTMTQVHERIERRLGRALDDGWIAQYYEECYARFQTQLTAIDGVEALIKRVLGAGKKICVASQGPHEKMHLTLGVTGLRGYFGGHIFSARDVARPKPFPDLFEHAAKTLGVSADKCCVIEDSASGVKAALAAHMYIIHYVPQGATSINGAIRAVSMDDIFPAAR